MRGFQLKSKKTWLNLIGIVLAVVLVLLLPQYYRSGYMINAMIDSVRWIIFALSFDLVAGHIGAVSLGHPVFFGLGAYLTAILGKTWGLGFVGRTFLSAVLMALLALFAGIAFFRTRRVTFAIGTLGALIIAQLVVNNAYDLTGGPLCVRGVARPQFINPFAEEAFRIATPLQYYYLLLPLLLVTILLYKALTSYRIGRSFTAVREDEIRASAFGIYPLRYKLLAFSVGAGLVGALGSFQAQYITVVCPSELALSLTILLLIIVFVGGVGTMRGVILGAVIFSSLPRILETQGAGAISPAYQQLAYGVILVVVMIFFPDGLDGLLTRITTGIQKRYRARRQKERISDE